MLDEDASIKEMLVEALALLRKIDKELEPLRPLLKKISKARHVPAPILRSAIEKGLQQ